MPSVVENQVRWTEHPWQREGHEWSPGQSAAGGEMLWWRGLLPRVAAHLPASAILEIGPGFGRWTQHLLRQCDSLTVVDLTERCIEHCRQRFGGHPGFTAWTNDGESLAMVPDESIDFVFSFDSLVHAEAPVLRSYLRQLAEKLKPGGRGFIHHSNLRALTGSDQSVPSWVTRTNWRGESMSARLFREYCVEAGLHCGTQEVINWISRSQRADRHRVKSPGIPLMDVLSTFQRPSHPGAAPTTQVYVNRAFADEWRQMIVLARLYGRSDEATRPSPPASVPDGMSRVGRAVAGGGARGFAQRLRARGAESAEFVTSYVRDHLAARRVIRKEPIVNALKAGRCPDCGSAVTRLRECGRCHVRFTI